MKLIGRSTPDIKLLVVVGIKEHDLVGVLVNSIEEIDSMMKADVGIANGSEITNDLLRQKSDIVIIDPSLESIL